MIRRIKISLIFLLPVLLISVIVFMFIWERGPLDSVFGQSKKLPIYYRRLSLNKSRPKVIAKNLNTPWSVIFYKGSTLVDSRDRGRIYQLNKGKTSSIIKIAQVDHQGEGGLLGLAVAYRSQPDYDYLFAYYTTEKDNRVVRYHISKQKGKIRINDPRPIVTGIDFNSYHNGGGLAIGPDGHLYISTGDAGDPSHAQDLHSLNGKILRVDFNGRPAAKNPIKGSPIFSYGHRNVQGMTWAGQRMFASEFGQDTWDELNQIEVGKNYGWPIHEGIDRNSSSAYTDPLQQWHTNAASPSGIVYDRGFLFIANLRGQSLRVVNIDHLNEFLCFLSPSFWPDS